MEEFTRRYRNKRGIVWLSSRLWKGWGKDWRQLWGMRVVFRWHVSLGSTTAVLLFFFFSCANFLGLIDFFSLWQLTVLINVSMAAALLQTPVSVSLAGGGPTAPAVSPICCCLSPGVVVGPLVYGFLWAKVSVFIPSRGRCGLQI